MGLQSYSGFPKRRGEAHPETPSGPVGSLMQNKLGGGGGGAEARESKAGKVRSGKVVCIWAWPSRTSRTKAEQAEATEDSEVQRCSPRAFPIHPHPCRQAPPQRHSTDSAGCSHNPKLKRKLSAHPRTCGGLSPAPPAVQACPSQHSRLEEGPENGDSGAGGRGQWRSQKACSNWEPPPDLRGACTRLALDREGDEEPRGFASGGQLLGLGLARVPGNEQPGRRRGPDSRLLRCRRAGTDGQGAGARAAAGARGNGWVPRRTGAGRRLQEGWGRRCREGPRPAARRLTPPPAPPGSGGSSRRAPRAGRGRGRGRRRRRPPGRRGRRRASGNP